MLECLVNGEISAFVPVTNRGLHFADGVLELIPVLQGRPLRWQLHMDRLSLSCERLGVTAPAQAILLREVQTVSAGLAEAVVQIIVTRNGSSDTYATADDSGCTRIVSAHAYPTDALERSRHGVKARICDLRLSIQPALGGINHLNRLERVLATREMSGQDEQEGLLLDTEGNVISAIDANVFIVMGDRLLTPRLDRCGVRGILRAQVLAHFSARCEQRRIQEDFLREAHEVFLCDTVRGISPVTDIGDIHYGIGSVTREVQAWLLEGSRNA